MTANLKQSSFLILGFVVVVGNHEEKKQGKRQNPLSCDELVEIHSCVLCCCPLEEEQACGTGWRTTQSYDEDRDGTRQAATFRRHNHTLCYDKELKIKPRPNLFLPFHSYFGCLDVCVYVRTEGGAGVREGGGGVPLKNIYLSVHHLQNLCQA